MSTLHCPAEDCLIENQDRSDCLEYLCSNNSDRGGQLPANWHCGHHDSGHLFYWPLCR